jgi:hypothetical protein
MARSGKLFFEDAFLAKERITKETMEEVERLYADWSEEVGRMADFYKHHGTPSSPLSEQYYRQLQASMQVQSGIVAEEAEDLIEASLYKTSQEVIEANAGWLSQWGLGTQSSINMAFAGTSNQLVQRLITGQVYKSGWSLSSSIWGDNDKTLKDIYTIMASGQAQSKTVYEIAKDLQQYVNPAKRKDWNPLIRMKNTRTGEFEWKRLYKSKVDYSAQRLVRTLNQHCYQQSVVATTKNNPWVTGIRWVANGSRVCPLCEERDGTIYPKDDVPLDHPNGQCTMEPVIEEDKMIDDLVAWYNGEEGDYPEIDEFARDLGYEF